MNTADKNTRIMVACGGTGGHIFPGMAVAEILRERGCEVTLLLAGKQVERTVLAGWDGMTLAVPARGIARRSPGAALAAAWWMLKAVRQWLALLRPAPPAALLAMGSYASGGPVWAARRLGVPVVMHEANVVPGRAVRWLARWADAVAVNFPEARPHLRHPRVVVTGMPLRRRAPAAVPDGRLEALAPDVFTVLVMGGSAGAHRLNELAPSAAAILCAQSRPIQMIHLTGLADADMVRQAYRDAAVPHAVYPFLHDMPAVYRRAHLAVCRAGAATCAELSLYGVPALFIPYPHAAGGHQMANAKALARDGAADVMPESMVDAAKLAEYFMQFMTDPARAEAMRAAARARANPDAAGRVADLVLETARAGVGK